MKPIILVCGYAGAGKNTFAKLLAQLVNVREYTFAKGLKDIAASMGWNGRKDDRGRHLLQAIGAIGREYNINIWANNVVDDICKYEKFMQEIKEEQFPMPVITDFRFPNEYEVIKVSFPNRVVISVCITGRKYDLGKNANDVSETSLNDFKVDYVIHNNGSMEDFQKNVEEFVKHFDLVAK